MKKRLLDYINHIDEIIIKIESQGRENSNSSGTAGGTSSEDKSIDYDKLLEIHMTQIAFFQHERLIHLLVTLAFAILAFGTFFMLLISFTQWLCLLFALIVTLLIPYVMHYYLLENGVQKMYRQYDAIIKLTGKNPGD